MSAIGYSSLVLSLVLSANGTAPAPPVALSTAPVGKQVAFAALGACIGTDALAACKRSRAVVVVFVGTECPLAQRYMPRLVELDKKYRGQQVEFLAIDSNQQDSLAEIAHFAESHKIAFPVKKDPGNKVADLFGAIAHAGSLRARPRGRRTLWGLIDDQFGIGYAHNKPKQRCSRTRSTTFWPGRANRMPVDASVGCRIGRVNRRPRRRRDLRQADRADPARRTASSCHQAGEIAPFALTSYADAAAWAETIREVVDQPADASLARQSRSTASSPTTPRFPTQTTVALHLDRQWTPRGQSGSSLPPRSAAFPDGWRIPKPDLSCRCPSRSQCRRQGIVQYKYFTVDPGFKHDVWIRESRSPAGQSHQSCTTCCCSSCRRSR